MRSLVLPLFALLGLAAAWIVLRPGDEIELSAATTQAEEEALKEAKKAQLLTPGVALPDVAAETVLEVTPEEAAQRTAVGGAIPEEPQIVPAEPEPTYAVYGQVVDAFGRPVPGIDVTLKNSPVLINIAEQLGSENDQAFPLVRSLREASRQVSPSGSQPDLSGRPLLKHRETGPHGGIHSPDFGAAPTKGGPSINTRIEPEPSSVTLSGNTIIRIPQGGSITFDLEGREVDGMIVFTSNDGRTVRTDGNGSYDFGAVIVREQTRLVYGASLYLGSPPSEAVIPDDRPQTLRLPSTPDTGLAIDLTGPDDHPKPIPAWASFDLVSLDESVKFGLREPDPFEQELSEGRITVRGLAAGKWRAWIHCEGTQSVQQIFTVEAIDGLTRTKLEIPFPDDEIALGTPGPAIRQNSRTTTAAPDALSGMTDLSVKGQRQRGFAEDTSDAFFIHTIDGFGTGRFQNAYLEVVVEGVSGMCSNDSLGLEFRGLNASPRWAWSQYISALPGAKPWKSGEMRRLLLDLSQLPTKNGPLNFLEELQDGRLDVFAQDDTNILSLTLRTYR